MHETQFAAEKRCRIVIVEAGLRIVPFMDEPTAASIEKKLKDRDVRIMTDANIVAAAEGSVMLSNGLIHDAGAIVWMAGVAVARLARILRFPGKPAEGDHR